METKDLVILDHITHPDFMPRGGIDWFKSINGYKDGVWDQLLSTSSVSSMSIGGWYNHRNKFIWGCLPENLPEQFKVVKTPPPESIFPIAPNVNYVTKTGYVIRMSDLAGAKSGSLYSKHRIPGVTERGYSNLACWAWQADGTIDGLTPEWTDKLKIVAKLPVEIPALPEGCKWAGGHMQYRSPKNGEHFISTILSGITALASDDYTNSPSYHRFIVEKEAKVLTNIPFTGVGTYTLMDGREVHLDKNGRCLESDGIKDSLGQALSWSWNINGTIDNLGLADHTPLYLKRKKATVSSVATQTVKEEKEEVMKKETAIATGMFGVKALKFMGLAAWKTANYFVLETATIWTKKVLGGVRHVLFAGALATAGYSYYHPEVVQNAVTTVKDTVLSCLPSITITGPAILK